MSQTYGELLSKVVDDMCKYTEREDIFRRNDISLGHYYNVINPNKKTSGSRRFHCPTEWGVMLTRDSRNYRWIKTVAKDCGGLFISPEDIKELQDTEPEKVLEIFRKIIGTVT